MVDLSVSSCHGKCGLSRIPAYCETLNSISHRLWAQALPPMLSSGVKIKKQKEKIGKALG